MFPDKSEGCFLCGNELTEDPICPDCWELEEQEEQEEDVDSKD